MLQKRVYPYEYIDDWGKFNKTEEKMEDITDADYAHTKRVCKDFETKNREYHDLYVQSDTLLLAGVFENFRNMCLKIYELDPAKFSKISMAGSFIKRLN